MSCSCIALKVFGALAAIFILKKCLKFLQKKRCTSFRCLVGKTTLVTGANTGIGFETAKDFAKRGARVILACRNRDKAEEARDRIIEATDNTNVVVKIIDMASFQSVRDFAKDINDNEERLDILVNNAGALAFQDQKTKDGHQFLMQTNYYSSFLLTNLLIGLLKKSGPSRVINVSSRGGATENLKLDDLDAFPGKMHLYPNTKFCNIMFTIELAKKLQGTQVTTYSVHPGVVTTDIFREAKGIWSLLLKLIPSFIWLNCEEGAQTTLHTSLEKGIEHLNGEHFDSCERVKPYRSVVRNSGLERKLWEKTEELIQMKPEENQF